MNIPSSLGLRIGWATTLLVVAVGVAAFIGNQRVIRADRDAAATGTVVDTLNALLSQLKDAETGQRGFIITGDSAYLFPLRRARATLPSNIEAARDMFRSSPEQLRTLDTLTGLIARRFAEIDTTLALRTTLGLAGAARAVKSNSGKQSMDSIRAVVDLMSHRARDALVSTAGHAVSTAQFASTLIIAGTIVALPLALAGQTFVSRTVYGLERTSHSLAVANTQLSESNAALSREKAAAENARAEAIAADQAKVDFLAVMSHELRTPLNAILGYTSLLIESIGNQDPQHAVYLTRSREAGLRLLAMIDEILLFTKSGTIRHQSVLRQTDVAEVIAELIDEAQPGARRKELLLIYEPPPEPVFALGDRSHVRRVIGHLLDNAIKFTEAGTIRVSVVVSDVRVKVLVADTGIGIEPEQLERMFEPFSQADAARTRRAEGAGMGLAVARRTAQLIGGDISATSARGRGSVFTVMLTRSAATLDPALAQAVATENRS